MSHPYRRRRIPALLGALALAATAAAAVGAPAQAAAPAAHPATADPGAGPDSITGPVPATDRPGDPGHDYPFYATPMDLKKAGYTEQEFFISGTATRYPSNPSVDDQRHAAEPIGSSPYTTRIVVRRPADPAKSAGVAVVDWQNVTAGHDIDTEWGTSGDYFVRHGWTWIGASVQRVGVHGADSGATAGGGLKQWSPERYGPLDLTDGGAVRDDSQSFDVYTQIAELAKGTSSANPLSDLRLKKVYAAGASQSGRYLGVYYNTVQPIEHAYDGFLLAIGDSSLPPREDVGTKVIRVFTENDVYRGAAVPSRTAPDSSTLRTWHIAGASHVPGYSTAEDPGDFRATLGGVQERDLGPKSVYDCTNPGPSQVSSWAVFHSAYRALDRWVAHGTPAPHAEALKIVDPTPPAVIGRDANGIAQGGIRLPDVTAPIALNDGINSPASLDNPLSSFCVLYGTHRDFSQEQLDALYPSDKAYRDKVRETVDLLQDRRLLLPEDRGYFLSNAAKARVVD